MVQKPITELEVADLENLFKDAEAADKRLFAEMRTNLQLVAGEHYVREGSRYWNRIRDNKDLTNEQRLKLTKNHIQRITKAWRNGILSATPDVGIVPKNESELSDQKDAELHSAYYKHIKDYANFDEKKAQWAKNFTEIGEMAVKIFWDLSGGQILGYEPEMTEHPETGEPMPVMDPSSPSGYKQSETPIYGGIPCFETILPYNLKRDKDAQTMAESPYLINAKVIGKTALLSMVKDEEMRKKLEQGGGGDYMVFDNNTGKYRAAQDQILIKEIYFRPCQAAPKGYYYYWISILKLAEGTLPYGIFPIIWEGFEEQSSNPRCHSIIRHVRPCQVEVNRAASKMAEHQVCLGDDKVWIAANCKVNQGAMLPGIRVNTYTGMPPTVTPGRSGEQYMPYLEAQIDEMYKLADLDELLQDAPTQQDLYTQLYAQFRNKKKFVLYGDKFERFLVKVVKTALQLAKECCSEDEFIQAVGKSEQINLAEFKKPGNICHEIKCVPQADDAESQMGKQLVINHAIQYIGPNLDKEDIGMMLRLSPFLNKEKMFQKFTSKYDSITNDILAMDRGQMRAPRPFDDHKYVINALTARMSQGDFEFMAPQIQGVYQQKLKMHEAALSQQIAAEKAAEAGFIPSGGYLVKCDFYSSNPKDPNSIHRVAIPSEAIAWLLQRLETQGSNMQELQQLPGGVLQDISSNMTRQPGSPAPQPGGQQPPPQRPGFPPPSFATHQGGMGQLPVSGYTGPVNPVGGLNGRA